MRFKFLKIIFFLCVILYNLTSYSKATISNNFNQKYLSNYFSALLSYNNQQNDTALKFFESSKQLIKRHDTYLRDYIFSLVLAGEVEKAIRQANFWKKNKNILPLIIPMIFIMVITIISLIIKANEFIGSDNYMLFSVTLILAGLISWMIFEGFSQLKKKMII